MNQVNQADHHRSSIFQLIDIRYIYIDRYINRTYPAKMKKHHTPQVSRASRVLGKPIPFWDGESKRFLWSFDPE